MVQMKKEILWQDVKQEDKIEIIEMLSHLKLSELQLSSHTRERMEQRHIPLQQVLNVFYHIDKAKIVLLHFIEGRCTLLLRKRVSKYQDICVCYDIHRNMVTTVYYNNHQDHHETIRTEYIVSNLNVHHELQLIQKNIQKKVLNS